ncbi:MAG: cyclic nucleotide-binding domain-containing protein [Bradymonadaceae bacterium]|nr:cyclic nucleotide-binding domain-containing protein [Lujinxingiaceae bacterium]
MTDASENIDAQTESPGGAETLFATSELFKGLSHAEVREIVHASELLTYKPGDLLFSQGEAAAALFIISQGELEVRATMPMGEDIVLAVLGAGTVVGEMSLLEGGPRSASVRAISDCQAFRLSREAFERLRSERQPSAYKIILRLAATVGERRRQTDARIEEVFTDPESHIDKFEHQVHDMLGRLRMS